MAIPYARFDLVQRSEGQNSCQKSAYNNRTVVRFEGTKFQEPCTYSFINCKDGTAYSTVLLPNHVDEKFKDLQYLWNTVEKVENRINSQVSFDFVAALPKEKQVTMEDKIELTTGFIEKYFVSHGSIVQVDIHYPSDGENGKNWHFHAQGTLREIDETGLNFVKNKMRGGFLPDVRYGKVYTKEYWMKLWADYQNEFFKRKGYDIVVDPIAIVPGKHIGAQKSRGECQSLLEENGLGEELNQEALKDPKQLLNHILKSQSVFDYHTVEYHLQKVEEITSEEHDELVQKFWKQPSIVPLFSEKTGALSGKYTVLSVIEEEKRILRNGDRVKNQITHSFSYSKESEVFAKHLRTEQKEAFKKTIEGYGLVCINGLAGTGKSVLLEALKNFYEDSGYTVRGMGPDCATCAVLRQKGFEYSDNIHNFLFSNKRGDVEIQNEREVWIVDEASKIGNSSFEEMLRLAASNNVKVILSGDISQLSPVERGTGFTKFCEKFGYVSLENVQRQEKEEDRQIVKLLSGLQGEDFRSRFSNTQKAIDMIESQKGFYWDDSKENSIKSLIKSWAIEKVLHSKASSLILALKKDEVQVLNDVVRLYRKHSGELGDKDYLCQTKDSTFVLSEGDHIIFKQRNKDLCIENGDRGIVRKISAEKFSVELLGIGKSEMIEFSPKEYSKFQLGYVSTAFGAQGATFDRVFVMSSPQMRLDSYYVACSRHRQESKVFVSANEIKNIATLKKLATREENAESTIGFVTEEALTAKQKLDKLKNSKSLLKRTYGKAKESVSKWDIWTRFSDLSENSKFYRPDIERDKGLVLRIMDNESDHPTRVIKNNSFIQTDKEVEIEAVKDTYMQKVLSSKAVSINPAKDLTIDDSIVQEIQGQGVIDRELEGGVTFKGYEFIQELSREMAALKKFSKEAESFNELSNEKASLLSKYLVSLEDCQKIKEKNAEYYPTQEWKQAVIKRNKAAYALSSELDKKEIKALLDTKAAKELRIYSQKQESYQRISQQKETSVKALEKPVLSSQQQSLVKAYKEHEAKSVALYAKVSNEVEEKGIDKFKTTHSTEWIESTQLRNEMAHHLQESFSNKEIRTALSKEEIRNLEDYSRKHKLHLESKISEGSQKFVDDYLSKVNKASAFHAKAAKEAEEKGIAKFQTSVKDSWFAATGERNQAAKQMIDKLSPEELQKVLSDVQLKNAKDYATKCKSNRSKPKPELPKAKQRLLEDYQKKSIHASSLRKIGLEEAEKRNISFSNTSVAQEFFHSSSIRNEAAYTLNRTLSKADLEKVFSEEQIKYLKGYADKYEANRERQEKNTPKAIEDQLKSNMESLCYHLFPDGYTDRTATSFRYGSHGSLSVNVAGQYVGSFKHFESDDKGGPLALIQRVKECSFAESVKYAKEFLGICDQITLPKSHKAKSVSNKSNWISMVPPANVPPPSLEVVYSAMAKTFNEVARYKYCDEKGNLLFCILRLEPKEGGKKQIRHLSYGFHQKNPSQKRWSMYGYQSESKAIYGLEKLYANPNARVLIVEGEKAADSANKLLEKEGTIAISWIGGTGSVEKVDWSHLKGRDVTIWPDNDRAGLKAANSIISNLRQQGVSSLKLVDPDMLEKRLPEKWDIADPLPKGFEASFIKDSLKNAKEQTASLKSVIAAVKKPQGKEDLALFKSFVGDILCKVENRLRGDLEKKHGNKTWEINSEITKEVTKIVDSKNEVSKSLQGSGIQGSINDRLTAQVLYHKASKGVEPTPSEIGSMRKTLSEVGYAVSQSQGKDALANPNIANHLFDKAFMQSRESGQLELSARLLKNAMREQTKSEAKVVSDQVQRDLSSANQAEVQRRQLEM